MSDLIRCQDAINVIKEMPSVEPERKTGKCTKINCPYRTEHKNGKWKNIALFTRECSECGAQFHELEYDNFCPNCGADMRGGNE